ncbi:MAG: hypothetical protein A2Z29_11060 [Chloroflexi bacterium RBG_16_56_11]|nr:MAG: hypothetical protein A2Z29_11060 [Chloroflexi bacterium RBG_16_56_11]
MGPVFRPLDTFEDIEEIIGNAFDAGLMPKVDMYEEGKELVVKAELPGLRKKDLDVRVDGDVLTIKAEKKEEKETKEDSYYTRERNFGRFVRYITLPNRVDAEKVTATLKKGLLEVRLTKVEEPETKRIEVKTK